MNREDRIKRRVILEDPDAPHRSDVGWDIPLDAGDECHPIVAARIAALEAEDTANPIAATAVARRPLELVLDEAAVIAKFTQEETQ